MRIGDTYIDPLEVEMMELDVRHYANTSPDVTLVLTMRSGRVLRVHHEAQFLGGVDAYAVEKEIIKQKEGKE